MHERRDHFAALGERGETVTDAGNVLLHQTPLRSVIRCQGRDLTDGFDELVGRAHELDLVSTATRDRLHDDGKCQPLAQNCRVLGALEFMGGRNRNPDRGSQTRHTVLAVRRQEGVVIGHQTAGKRTDRIAVLGDDVGARFAEEQQRVEVLSAQAWREAIRRTRRVRSPGSAIGAPAGCSATPTPSRAAWGKPPSPSPRAARDCGWRSARDCPAHRGRARRAWTTALRARGASGRRHGTKARRKLQARFQDRIGDPWAPTRRDVPIPDGLDHPPGSRYL